VAYYTGLATNRGELLDGLQSSAVAEGWTLLHRGQDNGGGTITTWREDVLILRSPGGLDFTFAMESSTGGQMEVGGIIGTYNPANAYSSQSGWQRNRCYAFNLPCRAWHCFVGPTYLYGILETDASHYRHFGCGYLNKFGTYAGGRFCYGHTYYSTTDNRPPFMYAAALTDGAGSTIISYTYPGGGETFYNNSNTQLRLGYYASSNTATLPFGAELIDANGGDQFNRQSVLVPIYCAGLYVDDLVASLGTPPDLRGVNGTFMNPEHELILGGDTWKCFPVGKRGASENRYESGNWFLAFLKSSA
jgi:hypothetical protein